MSTWYLTRKTSRQLSAALIPFPLAGLAVSENIYTITTTTAMNFYIWARGAPNEFSIEFDIKRVLQDANHEVNITTNTLLGAGASLTWNTTTGQWVLTSGAPDTDCGTVGANTWCHVKLTINRSTTTLTVQVDSNASRSRVDADMAECYGITFGKIEGQTNPNETFVKNITVDYARPTSTSSHLIAWSCSAFADITTSPNVTHFLGAFNGSDIETKDNVDKALHISDSYTVYTVLQGGITSGAITRMSIWLADDGGLNVVFVASGNLIFKILGGNIRWNTNDGTVITTYTPNAWNNIDFKFTTSGTNTLVNVRVNDGDWGSEQTSAWDLPISSQLQLGKLVGYTRPWIGPNIYLLDEGWISPTLTSPTDISMTEGDSETLSWTPTGDGGTYSITRDGDEVASGEWTSGVAITYDLSTETVGEYAFICTITDTIDTPSDTVVVTVASGAAPYVPDSVGASASTGGKEVIVKETPRMNVLAHEPDDVHRRYHSWRKSH